MKNTLKRVLSLAAVALVAFSCSSENGEEIGKYPVLAGTTWEYSKPICEIDYPKDSIQIVMGMGADEKISFTADQVMVMYDMFVGGLLESYIDYCQFIDDKLLKVGYTMDDEVDAFAIQYSQVDKYIQIDMAVVNPAMPKISINYIIESVGSKKYMDVYFEKNYITLMAQQMLPVFLPEMMGEIIPEYDQMPEMVQTMIVTSLTNQINTILSETNSLKVGLQLKEIVIK